MNNMQTAKRLEGISEYYFATKLREIAQMRAQGIQVLNWGIGSPDLPPAPEVIKALNSASQRADVHGYQGYSGIPELRAAFADWYKQHYQVELDPNGEILPLMGSKEGILHIAMTYLEPGAVALVPNPGYPTYRSASMLAGAMLLEYDLTAETDWLPDFEALERQDLQNVRLMWVNYPNMPTGRPAETSVFERLIAFGKKHKILIVNDNPYSFILNDSPKSILSVAGAMETALELNSLSKAQNMAGWRVGMLAGKAEYLRDVLRFKSNMDSGMFLPVQLAAVKALQLPLSWYVQLNEIYRKRQKAAKDILESLGCQVTEGQQGLFLWGKIPDQYPDAFALSDEILQNQHIFLTPGGIFGSNGNRYLRISLCNDFK